jgi:hypothetical protein
MNPSRRSLCIVSRDPLQCSELVLSLQASLEPEDEVEIIMDRRRARDVFETKFEGHEMLPVDRRRNLDVDLEVRTKGFAIVPGAAMAPRITAGPDADDRARFENILSFKRRREPHPGRAIGAASAVMVALILTPSLNTLPDRVDAPATEVTKPASGKTPNSPAPGIASRGAVKPSGPRAPRAPRPSRPQGVIETYAARVEDATGRVVSKARGVIDRVRSEVIGNTPMSAGPELPDDDAPVTVKRRPADSP